MPGCGFGQRGHTVTKGEPHFGLLHAHGRLSTRFLRSSGRLSLASQASAAARSVWSHCRATFSIWLLRWFGSVSVSAQGAATSGEEWAMLLTYDWTAASRVKPEIGIRTLHPKQAAPRLIIAGDLRIGGPAVGAAGPCGQRGVARATSAQWLYHLITSTAACAMPVSRVASFIPRRAASSTT
jgi:hypothetical protein